MSNSDKIILDLCGGTGSWSKPYKDAGYDVRVITLPEHDILKAHFRSPGNIDFGGMRVPIKEVYGILAAPPCTMFSHNRTIAKEPRDLKSAMELVDKCLKIIWQVQYDTPTGAKTTSLRFWALENPGHGILSHFLGKPAFEFNPWEFGDMYKKRTYLWGNFNEPIKTHFEEPDTPKFDYMKSKEIAPEHYGKLTRTERRAITPQGFAEAFFKVNP